MKQYSITTYEHYGKRAATNALFHGYREFKDIDEAIKYAHKKIVWWNTNEEFVTCEHKLKKSYEQYCYLENPDWNDPHEYSVKIELVAKKTKTKKIKKITISELRDMGYELEEEE